MAVAADRHMETTRRILVDLFRWYGPRDFTVRFWDAGEWGPDPGQPSRFTWVFRHSGAFRAANLPPGPAPFGAAFLYDDFDVEGDMIAFLHLANHLHRVARVRLKWYEHLSIGWRMLSLPNTPRPRLGHGAVKVSGGVHTQNRDLQAVSYHYNFSNRCYELILGPSMGYTSGVYETESDDLTATQYRKFDLICRKLRLQPGQRLLDIGCGWAGLIMHAVRHYGVEAVGITISQEQLTYARARIEAAGLQDRCRVQLLDYRNLDPAERFDAITTIEVAEHFGVANFPTYFNKCYTLLNTHGRLLLQQITLLEDKDPTAAPKFNQKYVFPDGELAAR